MIDKVFLYISAALDLSPERALINRAVTEIPMTLGWKIMLSPAHGEPADLGAVAKADVHLLILGSDIRAPIGIEWLTARRAGRNPELFLQEGVNRTMAASEFIHYMDDHEAVWHTFKNQQELRKEALLFLSRHLLNESRYYSLSAKEQDELKEWQKELEAEKPKFINDTRGGAGEGGLIISVERYIPSEGVLIQPKQSINLEDDKPGPE
jgi:hypothetical protein